MRRPARLRAHDREAGSATVLVVMFAVVFLALAGLVIDGGLAINARERVTDDVEQAARAGSQQLDLDTLRGSGQIKIEPVEAANAARLFLAARRHCDANGCRADYPPDQITVQVNPDQNTVTVGAQTEQRTTLLSLVGVGKFTIRAQAQARPSVGIANGGPP